MSPHHRLTPRVAAIDRCSWRGTRCLHRGAAARGRHANTTDATAHNSGWQRPPHITKLRASGRPDGSDVRPLSSRDLPAAAHHQRTTSSRTAGRHALRRSQRTRVSQPSKRQLQAARGSNLAALCDCCLEVARVRGREGLAQAVVEPWARGAIVCFVCCAELCVLGESSGRGQSQRGRRAGAPGRSTRRSRHTLVHTAARAHSAA
jgi:hypothetical protein